MKNSDKKKLKNNNEENQQVIQIKSILAGSAFELVTLVSALSTWGTFIYQAIKAYKFSEGYFPEFIFSTSLTTILSFIPFLSITTLLLAIFLWKRRGPNPSSYFAVLTFSLTFLLPLITLIMMYFSIKEGKIY